MLDKTPDKVAGFSGIIAFNCGSGKDFNAIPLQNLD